MMRKYLWKSVGMYLAVSHECKSDTGGGPVMDKHRIRRVGGGGQEEYQPDGSLDSNALFCYLYLPS